MITIQRKKNTLTIKGHALFDVYGRDIVCAGVSALFWALIRSVNELTVNTAIWDKVGDKVTVTINGPISKAELLVDCFLVGCKEIELEHPNNVKVETEH